MSLADKPSFFRSVAKPPARNLRWLCPSTGSPCTGAPTCFRLRALCTDSSSDKRRRSAVIAARCCETSLCSCSTGARNSFRARRWISDLRADAIFGMRGIVPHCPLGCTRPHNSVKPPIKLCTLYDYFSDRENGPRPRTGQVIEPQAWAGFVTLISTRAARGAFGRSFPLTCPDGSEVYGTDEDALGAAMRAEVDGLKWPLETARLDEADFLSDLQPFAPLTLQILDFLEFCWRHVASVSDKASHAFFHHTHLSFNQELGRDEFARSPPSARGAGAAVRFIRAPQSHWRTRGTRRSPCA